jgi:hypothetical protein
MFYCEQIVLSFSISSLPMIYESSYELCANHFQSQSQVLIFFFFFFFFLRNRVLMLYFIFISSKYIVIHMITTIAAYARQRTVLPCWNVAQS